jgi:hypothetical protein
MPDDVLGKPPAPSAPSIGIPVPVRPEVKAMVKQLMKDPEVANPLPPATPEEAAAAGNEFGSPLVDEPPVKDADPRKPEPEAPPQYTGGPFDNPEFHKACDERAGDVNLDTTVGLYGRVSQWVPVLPGKLEVQFCTQSGEESIWIGRRTPPQDMVGYFALRLEDLAVSLRALRGSMFGDKEFEDPFGLVEGKLQWREEVLLANIAAVQRLPNNVLNILLKQLDWFNLRVDKAMADLRNC